MFPFRSLRRSSYDERWLLDDSISAFQLGLEILSHKFCQITSACLTMSKYRQIGDLWYCGTFFCQGGFDWQGVTFSVNIWSCVGPWEAITRLRPMVHQEQRPQKWLQLGVAWVQLQLRHEILCTYHRYRRIPSTSMVPIHFSRAFELVGVL